MKPLSIYTVWPDNLELARAAAHLVVNTARLAVADKGYFTLALSGGSTPKLLYALLAQEPFRSNMPWKNTLVAFGDERFVPHSSDESNYKMAAEAMLDKVPLLKKNILVVSTEKIKPPASAAAYEKRLRQHVSTRHPFDLVLLGIGDEGHTASIFPGSPLMNEKRKWVADIWVEEKQSHRISFTMPFINRAKHIAFLVSGAGKKAILKKIFSGKETQLPATAVRARGTVHWFLDKAAAGEG